MAGAFNIMIQQLRHSLDTLKQWVANRTAQLEAANKELESFTYSVFHNLRAPRQYIDSFISILQAKTKTNLDDQAHHYMEIVVKSTWKRGYS